MSQPAVAAGYRPRAPSNPLKEIVGEHLDELFGVWDERFLFTYGPLHPRMRELLESFLRCGDFHFGFLRLKCCNPKCDSRTERLVPFS